MRAIVRNLGWIVGGLVVVGLLIYAFRPLPAEVDTAAVTRGPLVVTVTAEGKTRIKERYVVSAPLGGQLLRLRHRPGDPVSPGQTVLATIEPGDPSLLDARSRAEIEAKVKATEAARQQADAGLKRAQSAHQLAARQWERVRGLGAAASADERDTAEGKERVAADEVRAAEFAVRVAEFEHEQAKAARVRVQPRLSAEAEQERFDIRSPIGGLVLRVFQESAAVVSGGTKLLELGDPRDLEMEIDVLSTDAVKMRPGARVIVDHWGGPEPLAGRVRVVEPAGFLKVSALGVEEQRVNVIADFTDPLEKRKPLGDAYRVEARIVISEGEAVKVPAGGLFRRGGGWACFAVRDGRAKLTDVAVGRTNGLDTEVLSGLGEGDAVVVHPSDRVKDGGRVVRRE
jgi:HlyD family secretion protein